MNKKSATVKSVKRIVVSFWPKPKKISKHRRIGNGLGYLMWEHFGEGTQLVWHDGVSGTEYRKGMMRLLEGTRVAVLANLKGRTDRHHLSEALDQIDFGIKLVKSAQTDDELNEAVLVAYIRLSSLLLGQRVNHWREEKVSLNKREWKLDHYRSLQFHQNDEQKARLVSELMTSDAERHGLPGIRKAWDERALYIKENGPTEFLDWFRSAYPLKYLELFDRKHNSRHGKHKGLPNGVPVFNDDCLVELSGHQSPNDLVGIEEDVVQTSTANRTRPPQETTFDLCSLQEFHSNDRPPGTSRTIREPRKVH